MRGAKSESVEGVLNGPPAGVGGGSGWALVFELVPWRIEGSTELSDVPLRVEIPLSERELDRWMDRISDGTRVEVAVQRLRKPADKPWWLADGRLPVRRITGSALLLRARADRAKPVVIQDGTSPSLVKPGETRPAGNRQPARPAGNGRERSRWLPIARSVSGRDL